MATWTRSAERLLDAYLAQTRKRALGDGADPIEVADDLRRHIHAEVVARRLEVVSADELESIARRLGLSATEPEPTSEHSDVAARRNDRRRKRRVHPFLLIFGVILPVIAVAIEIGTRMSAGIYFDPMPDEWHLAILLSVPLIQLLAWLALRGTIPGWQRWLGPLVGFSMGLMIYYTLLYAPLAPFACVAIIFYGIGFLPLAPLLALISALRTHALLKKRASQHGIPIRGIKRGMALSGVALILTALPLVLTRQWSQDYVAGSDSDKTSLVRKLRWFGRERVLLQDCYASTGRGGGGMFGLFLQGKAVSPEDAREIYYRVSGDAFNSKAPPQLGSAAARWNFLDDFTWDDEAGGTIVGGRLKGLSLAQSRIDGLVNADAATVYTEWIMEFKNVAPIDREARAQIQLPPGGVVSRLTLWVNGEEREAAFAGTSQVRAAYEQVVRVQRRDPVLVTKSGPDRVLVQCFPVPRDGGTIKIRFGVTAPLHLESADTGALVWPRIIERNFGIADHFEHSLWVEAKLPLRSEQPAFKSDRSKEQTFGLRGQLTDAALGDVSSVVRIGRDPKLGATWVSDPHGLGGEFIQQQILAQTGAPPSRVVFVVDGSKTMRSEREAMASAFRQLPAGLEAAFVFAGDEVEVWIPPRSADAELASTITSKLGDAAFVGGRDNLPALLRGWDLAAEKAGSAVIWIHGPQPQLVTKAEQIDQRVLWRFGKGAPTFHGFQAIPGPDRMTELLHTKASMENVPRLGSAQEDLVRLFDHWNPAKTRLVAQRQRLDAGEIEKSLRGKESSRHLARLWANDEVTRLIGAGHRAGAIELAAKHQLVTLVSGAVVLETKQQFEQAGLEPVNRETVPTVPEPGTVGLLLIAVLGLMVTRFRRRNAARRASSVSTS